MHPSEKKLKPSRKNLNLPEKLPLPKNSITISETIYQTLELNLNPFPKNPNPLWKILNLSWKNVNPLPPKIFFNPPWKCLNTPWKFHMQPPWKFVKATEYFLTPLKISHTPWKFLNPLNIS